jgi:formate/nitrite transporter FocA (FNT family)
MRSTLLTPSTRRLARHASANTPRTAACALSAGLDIGFSLFLMAVMATLIAGTLPRPVTELLVANLDAVGFLFVVLGRSELFTEQTTLPVLDGKASVGALARTWGVVYAGNLLGAAFAGLPRLELPIEGGRADRQRARLSGAAGQHGRDTALPALHGGDDAADD